MKIKDLIEFEPINLTQILLTLCMSGLIIFAFKNQLDGFFLSLQERPIKFSMTSSSTTVELNAPVKTHALAQSTQSPHKDVTQIDIWEASLSRDNPQKSTNSITLLKQQLKSLKDENIPVIEFDLNLDKSHYFTDAAMKTYLSYASEYVQYIALNDNGKFVALLPIDTVVAKLATNDDTYKNFGHRLASGEWRNLPALITAEEGFVATPSIKVLYSRLQTTQAVDLPLVREGRLHGLLNYESIAEELYAQATSNSPAL